MINRVVLVGRMTRDPYKIPKIVEVTQRWISEEDNKILDRIS